MAVLLVFLAHRSAASKVVRLTPSAQQTTLHAINAAGYVAAETAAGNPAISLLAGSPNHPQRVVFLGSRGGTPSARYVATVAMAGQSAPWTVTNIHTVVSPTVWPGMLSAAPARGQPLFIRLAEATRHWLGPKPVALLENGWYSLTDLMHQRTYWLTHRQPTPLPLPSIRQSPSVSVPAAGRTGGGGAAPANLPTPGPVAGDRGQGVRAALVGGTSLPVPTPKPGLATLPKNLIIPHGWLQAQDEGVWLPAGQRVAGQVAMERTFVLPDPQRPYERVDLVWINPALAHVHLAAGTRHPRTASGFHGAGMVPPTVRSRLLAAFNGGFKRIGGNYAGFGFRANGRWYLPPSPGLATLAVYPSGRVVLGAWGRDLPVTPWGRVVSSGPLPRDLLQNLPPLVDHGRVSPQIADHAAWGETVNNAVRVWRSGLGQTAAGDLVYVAGTPLTAQTLAQVLELAGSRRAMELDINSYWVTFNFYRPRAPGSSQLLGEKLLPAMVRSAVRYLRPDSRSFVYLTAAH